MPRKVHPPIHPGEILAEDFMKPLGLSQNALARALDVPPGRIGEIVNGRRAITGDTALRLERYFGASAKMWLGLQADYELESAKDAAGAEIRSKIRPRKREAEGAARRADGKARRSESVGCIKA